MSHTCKSQAGMTAISIAFLLFIFGCFVLFGLRLFPIYYEHFGIKAAMRAVINQPAEKRKRVQQIRKLFIVNAQINGANHFNVDNVKNYVFIKKKGGKKYLHVQFQNERQLFKNVYLAVKTDEMIEIPKGE